MNYAGDRMIRCGILLLIATMPMLPLTQIWAAERRPLPDSARQAHVTAVNVIFDTDMYSDIDDMLALAMLHTLQDRAEVKLLAVTVGTEAKWTAPYVDLVDTFYGHEDIPVGMVRGGITAKIFNEKPLADQPYSPNGINYTQYLAQLENKDGSLVYPHRLINGEKAEEAVHLLRKVLNVQTDVSVVMVQCGYLKIFIT